MNSLIKFALMSLIAISVISCGKSNKKATINRDRDVVSDQAAANTDALKDKEELFQDAIERRLQFENEFTPQVFVASKDDNGLLRIIFLPANPQSLDKNDHKPLWFFNAENDDQDGYNAYHIDVLPIDGENSSVLGFPSAPADEQVPANINILDSKTLEVHCAEKTFTYAKDEIASADNMQFISLSKENKDFYKSPCSYIEKEEEQEVEKETAPPTEQLEPIVDIASETDLPIVHCSDSQEEIVEQDDQSSTSHYAQSIGTMKVKGIIRCFHDTGKCVVIESEIVGLHNTNISTSTSTNSCVYSAPESAETETALIVEEQVHDDSSDVVFSESELPYCSSADQRKYFKKQEEIKAHQNKLVELAKYCELRKDLGSRCKAVEFHREHQKIATCRKKIGKILNRCHKRKVVKTAEGYKEGEAPEINTCGVFNREILKNKRIKADRLKNKINDIKANCQLDPEMCADKKLKRLEKLLKKTQDRIAKKEELCQVNR